MFLVIDENMRLCLFINIRCNRPEGEFSVKKVMSLEGVWYEVDCKVTDSSYQTPSKLITFLTKNSPSGQR